MNLNKILTVAVALYVFAMLLYWFQGDDSSGWVVYYYSIEKIFSAIGFFLLGAYTGRKVAYYASAVCVFMFLYFLYCMFFGHAEIFAVGAFLAYSLIIIFVINKTFR